jgi:hypothetical protein
MIDVKKLITGFLILAVAATCSGLIFSLINFSPAVADKTASGITIGGGVADNTNAFLPTESQVQEVADALAPELASSSMMVSSTDPSNLTDNLATAFVNGVVAANPDGPTGTDTDGNATFAAPDVNTIAASIANTTSTQTLPTPNWDIEAKSIPITSVSSNSTTLTSYGTAVSDILSNHLNAQVTTIVENGTDSADTEDISYVTSQVRGALQDAASLKTPTSAEAYQRSLLTELVYEKNMLDLYTVAQTDPVKASLVFQQEEDKFSSVQQNLLNQAQDLENNTLSLQQAPKTQHGDILLSFINNTFSVPQAHAMWPVFDPATWGLIEANQFSTIGHQLLVMLKNTLLQILKNTLIAIIQKKVLVWIQGSGAPRFITNWGTQLVNAAQMTAINAINAQMSCGVYPAFVGQIKVTLNAFYKTGDNTCANQFAAALGANTFQSFYNNFQNGGFVAFGGSTLPSGNPYGSLFFNAQSVGVTYSNQQASSQVKAQASGGFKGGEKCDDGSDPSNGEHTECEGNDITDYPIYNGQTCTKGGTPVTEENGGICGDGSQPVVTTPSAVTGFALNSGVDATPKQIAAANDIAGILNSVLSSLLTSLASTAVNAAGQLVNNELTSINSSSITAGATTATSSVAQIPLECDPSTQTMPSALATISTSTGVTAATTTAPATLSATGGTLDANDNSPVYFWTDTNGASSTGAIFSDTFATSGTYTITLGDSTGDASTTCTVIQQ